MVSSAKFPGLMTAMASLGAWRLVQGGGRRSFLDARAACSKSNLAGAQAQWNPDRPAIERVRSPFRILHRLRLCAPKSMCRSGQLFLVYQSPSRFHRPALLTVAFLSKRLGPPAQPDRHAGRAPKARGRQEADGLSPGKIAGLRSVAHGAWLHRCRQTSASCGVETSVLELKFQWIAGEGDRGIDVGPFEGSGSRLDARRVASLGSGPR